MNCQFCGKEFSSKSNLNYHIKTAKYCLKQREILEEKLEFRCNYCNNTFLRKYNLDSHLSTCKFKKRIEKEENENKLKQLHLQEIENLKNEIDNLKHSHFQEIENLKQYQIKEIEKINEYHNKILDHLESHSKDFKQLVEKAVEKTIEKTIEKSGIQYIQNNNTDNSVKKIDNKYLNVLAPFDLTREKVEEVIKSKFTEEVFYHGTAGIVKLIFKELIRTKDGKFLVHCSDISRKVFIYLDQSGIPIKDYRAQKLLEIVGPPIIEKNQEIIEEILKKYARYQLEKVPDESTGFIYDENRVNFSNDIYQNNNRILSEPNEFITNLSIHCANIPIRDKLI